ncbi:unnamed protein product [Didymodactylos carnosus]|uniref:Uncharacterized protein n=1 Tax=Didymodactylos carnosus TaxID=1234261 RepID=A0A8S2QYC5_9BILA|nr:unnamed protein product [Didymodactylos carnosus]CAF4127393.1 unnamed protein product [Didymodactylos carnosus]
MGTRQPPPQPSPSLPSRNRPLSPVSCVESKPPIKNIDCKFSSDRFAGDRFRWPGKSSLNRWIKVDSHTNIECHLPQLIPLDYIDHIYMSQNTFDSLNTNACKVIDTIFKNRITKTSHHIELDQNAGKHGPKSESKAPAEYQDFVVNELIEKFSQHNIQSTSRPVRGTVITIPSTDFTDHFVLPLTISQAYEQYKIDHPQVSADMTVYIYWQVLNGDMMLTLSNEAIDTGESQLNLRCLICYIAEKLSTKDIGYHKNVSYLHSGGLFQHEIVLKEQRYLAGSNAFYVGCNTDDFMTFCLEIQRSTLMGDAVIFFLEIRLGDNMIQK